MLVYPILHSLSSIIGLIFNVIIQVICYMILPKFGLLKSIFAGFIFGFIGLVFIETKILFIIKDLQIDFYFGLTANILTYLALSYCYFHFINWGETARRIRIMREIYDSGGGLALEDILKRYNAKEIIDKRIGRLINNKQIILHDDKYYIGNSSMLIITKIITSLKKIIMGKKSEFD